jgi:hypothetical protein
MFQKCMMNEQMNEKGYEEMPLSGFPMLSHRILVLLSGRAKLTK